jgi:hypothetical protein
MPLKTLGPIGPRAVGERVKIVVCFQYAGLHFLQNICVMYGWIYEYFHVNTVLMYSESYVQYTE